MSDNDERRKPLGISDIYDLIALEAEKGGNLSLHDSFEIALTVSISNTISISVHCATRTTTHGQRFVINVFLHIFVFTKKEWPRKRR